MFTEYGIAESIRVDDPRFVGVTLERDTPDMVIYQPDRLLLGLEAKMFERVSGGNLRQQLTRQEEVLRALANGLNLPQEQVHQVALLPRQTADQIGLLPVPVITWAELLILFHDGPRWALDVLDYALAHWLDLAGDRKGAGPDVYLTGAEIVRQFNSGEVTDGVMGRNLGLDGQPLREDQQSGAWRTKQYQVQFQAIPPNRNWFRILDFVNLLAAEETSSAVNQLVSWQVARDVVRLFDTQVLIRELHPGGGQYDVLALSRPDRLGREYGDDPALFMNRAGRIWAIPLDEPVANWAELLTEAGRGRIVTLTGHTLGLTSTPEVRDVGLSSFQVGLEALVTVLELSQRGLIGRSLTVTSAALDSSGSTDDSGWKPASMRPFPAMEALLSRKARLLASDDWRWWIISDTETHAPLTLLDLQDGAIWRPGDAQPISDVRHRGPAAVVAEIIASVIQHPPD